MATSHIQASDVRFTLLSLLHVLIVFIPVSLCHCSAKNVNNYNSLTDMSNAIHDLSKIVKQQMEEVKSIRTGVEGLKRKKYAFTVKLANKKIVGNGRRLLFDKETNNSSDAFDFTQSAFVCQEDGLYFFHATICCQRAESARYQIVRNSGDVLGFIYTQDAINSDCAGNGVTASLNTGDRIWLKSKFESHTDPHTYFTGFKVQ